MRNNEKQWSRTRIGATHSQGGWAKTAQEIRHQADTHLFQRAVPKKGGSCM